MTVVHKLTVSDKLLVALNEVIEWNSSMTPLAKNGLAIRDDQRWLLDPERTTASSRLLGNTATMPRL